MKIGETIHGNPWYRVAYTSPNAHTVDALRYEEHHTRLLLYDRKGGFWSPFCSVALASNRRLRRLVGVITTQPFRADGYYDILNAVAVDYDRDEYCKLQEFMPFEIKRGELVSLSYTFLLRGKNDSSIRKT